MGFFEGLSIGAVAGPDRGSSTHYASMPGRAAAPRERAGTSLMIAPNSPLIWLFDIDGTLIVTDGAARDAFSDALFEMTGIEDDLSRVSFGGNTDPRILQQLLDAHGLQWDEPTRERFWRATYARMTTLLQPGRGRVLPGVRELLDRLEREPKWVPALLTGNSAEMARIKLDHYGLADRFQFGAYGDEAPDRNALAQLAVRRSGLDSRRCLVLGDTELDIGCARAAGAWAVAVATGLRTRADLATHDPDLLLDSFANPAPLLDFARALPAD
jgi:phosphoglycolate phosphatase-like HAD superfamily hydrolase